MTAWSVLPATTRTVHKQDCREEGAAWSLLALSFICSGSRVAPCLLGADWSFRAGAVRTGSSAGQTIRSAHKRHAKVKTPIRRRVR